MCDPYLNAVFLALEIFFGNQVFTFCLWRTPLLLLLNLPPFDFSDYFSIFILADREEVLSFNFFYTVHSFIDFYLEFSCLSSFQVKQPQSF